MSLRSRLPSAAAASAVTISLTVAVGVALPATANATPCSGAAAAIQPPPNARSTPVLPGNGRPPVGHKPAGANERAALPRIGQLSRALLNVLSPRSAAVSQQAGVSPPPVPAPPAPAAAQQPVVAQPAPAAVPAPPPPPAPPGTSLVGWVTGPDSPNETVRKFGVTGTDLGIMWDNGDPANNQVLMAFGDTYGYCSVQGQQWRYNVLMRSNDGALSNTVSVPSGATSNPYSGSPVWVPGLSKQVVNTMKIAQPEKGIIPTAGIAVGRTQYMNFMSIRNWDADGRWSTNFSGIAASQDNGENWSVLPSTIRAAGPNLVPRATFVPGNENFQQGAFMRPGPGDPYLYSFSTPPGRGGSAFIARVAPNAVPNLNAYEYWNAPNNTWVRANPGAATPVIPGPVGEMSAQYNRHLNQYLALYCNGANDVVARTAPAPQGPWGPEQLLVRSTDYPGGIYAPYLHPWSTGKELYYNLSLWSAYNVMLMKTVLP